MDDVLVRKQQSVERCVQRAKSAWQKPSALPFEKDYDKQDIIVLNLHRACEQVLDMANYVIRKKGLGWPSKSAESFDLLERAGIINAALERELTKMVGFRNIVVHQYQDIDYGKVIDVLEKHADDLIECAGILTTSS